MAMASQFKEALKQCGWQPASLPIFLKENMACCGARERKASRHYVMKAGCNEKRQKKRKRLNDGKTHVNK